MALALSAKSFSTGAWSDYNSVSFNRRSTENICWDSRHF